MIYSQLIQTGSVLLLLPLSSVPGFPLYEDTDNGRAATHQLFSFVIEVWFAPMAQTLPHSRTGTDNLNMSVDFVTRDIVARVLYVSSSCSRTLNRVKKLAEWSLRLLRVQQSVLFFAIYFTLITVRLQLLGTYRNLATMFLTTK